MNFPLDGPWGTEMFEEFRGLGETINDEPVFIWKVWLEDESAGKAGGIYLFDFREDAQKYITMHTERMAGVGVTELDVIPSDVNEDLSTLTKATLS